MQHDCSRLLKDIEDILDAERALLRGGRFEFLADLAARKEGLIARLAGMAIGECAPQLIRVRDKARLNLALFDAAQRGLKAAQNRLDEIRANARTFNTYDSSGRLSRVAAGSSQHEKRA